jgi:hypothetical protein
MGILSNTIRICMVAMIVVIVAEVSKRSPRLGAILLSLPLVSILAFVFSWLQHRDLPAISQMAKDTLILVPLGLPFFVPLAFAARFGWNFWIALFVGMILGSITIGLWLLLTANR